jgi:hypothetical protein
LDAVWIPTIASNAGAGTLVSFKLGTLKSEILKGEVFPAMENLACWTLDLPDKFSLTVYAPTGKKP